MNGKRKNWIRRAVLVLLGMILGVNVYLTNARTIVGNRMPMPFGMGAAVVLSGSMEPTLSRGDLIFVRQADRAQLGDIVVYQSGGTLIVHRVVAACDGGLVTQGDANNAPDQSITTDQLKGVVVFSIPAIGTALGLLKTPAGTLAVLALAFALVELSFRRERAADEQNLQAVKEEIRRLKEQLGEHDEP